MLVCRLPVARMAEAGTAKAQVQERSGLGVSVLKHQRGMSELQAWMRYYQLDTMPFHVPFSAPDGGLTR